MIVTIKYDLDLDRIMDNIDEEIVRTIGEDEGIDWDCFTEAARKDLYKAIAERILAEWV